MYWSGSYSRIKFDLRWLWPSNGPKNRWAFLVLGGFGFIVLATLAVLGLLPQWLSTLVLTNGTTAIALALLARQEPVPRNSPPVSGAPLGSISSPHM